MILIIFRFSFGFVLISLVLSVLTSTCSDTYFVVKAMKARGKKTTNQPEVLMRSNGNGEGQDHSFFLLDSK